jgi:toxin YoeB
MRYTLAFSETALEDIEKHKKFGDKAVLKKIGKLLNELMEHPILQACTPVE